MHNIALQFSKNEMQHVIKVYTDVGSHTKGLAWIAFPAFHIPLAARRDICQFNLIFLLALLLGNLVF
ncbi:hypothetical protein D3C78_1804860 [compost metagenome]